MKAILFDRFGDPAEVLAVRDVAEPRPGPGEVLVRMIASPINPSDLLSIQGRYGRKPPLPSSAGFEGVGVVVATGSGILPWLRRGKRVAVLNSKGGNWQQQVVVPARQVVPVPAGVADEQAASFFVNPASALVMTQRVLRIPRGAWLLQSAAGSALGRMVIRLGRERGYQTINLVRRAEQVPELVAAGGDVALCTAEGGVEGRIQEVTKGAGVGYAIDAVGGETGSMMVRSLGRHGRMLVYGTLAEEPIRMDPRVLMVGEKTVQGFWLSEWVRDQNALTMLRLFRRIGGLLASGTLGTEVCESFAMSDIAAAVRKAAEPGRKGKVLIRLDRLEETGK